MANQVFNLTYLDVTVLAFGNNRATQNAGQLGVSLTQISYLIDFDVKS